MVIGGYDEYEGLLRVALKLDGQSAEVVMALGEVLPDPPAGAGLVVVVVVAGLDVVVVVAALLFFHGLVIRRERPTTTAATMSSEMSRRKFCFRLRVFCSASNRAWRPAFWR